MTAAIIRCVVWLWFAKADPDVGGWCLNLAVSVPLLALVRCVSRGHRGRPFLPQRLDAWKTKGR